MARRLWRRTHRRRTNKIGVENEMIANHWLFRWIKSRLCEMDMGRSKMCNIHFFWILIWIAVHWLTWTNQSTHTRTHCQFSKHNTNREEKEIMRWRRKLERTYHLIIKMHSGAQKRAKKRINRWSRNLNYTALHLYMHLSYTHKWYAWRVQYTDYIRIVISTLQREQ